MDELITVISIGLLIIAVSMFAIGVFFGVYTRFDHWKKDKNGWQLRESAIIVKITVSPFNAYSLKTELFFDDGFVYISFDTKKEYLSPDVVDAITGTQKYKLYVDDNIKIKLIQKAIKKHNEVMKREQSAV